MYTFCFTGVLMTVCKGLIPDEVCGLFLFPASCPLLLHTVSFKRDFFCFLPVILYFCTLSLSKGTFSVSCQLSCTFVHCLFQKGLFCFLPVVPYFCTPSFCFLPVVLYFCSQSLSKGTFSVSCLLSCTFTHICFLPVVLYFCTQSLSKGTFVYAHVFTQDDFRSSIYFGCSYCYGHYWSLLYGTSWADSSYFTCFLVHAG